MTARACWRWCRRTSRRARSCSSATSIRSSSAPTSARAPSRRWAAADRGVSLAEREMLARLGRLRGRLAGMAEVLIAFPLGFIVWFFTRYGLFGFYTIGPNERAVVTTFGRAQRVGDATTLQDPISETLRADERDRYVYPQVHVVG